MIRQDELVEAVRAYDPHADEDLLNRAYVFAMKAHGTQERASGDLYFTHPLEVAGILVGMHLDVATIATALLHDTIEDTLATLDEIEALFGKEIAFLDIEILNDPSGKPTVNLSTKASNHFGNPTFHISLSHSKNYATATVIALKGN